MTNIFGWNNVIYSVRDHLNQLDQLFKMLPGMHLREPIFFSYFLLIYLKKNRLQEIVNFTLNNQ